MHPAVLRNLEPRELSRPVGIYRIYPDQDLYARLALAELEKGSIVLFEKGVYDMPRPHIQKNIAVIAGVYPFSTHFTRRGNKMFERMQPFSSYDVIPYWGGFSVENLVESDEPVIECGGVQCPQLEHIVSYGKGADLLLLHNIAPIADPGPNRAEGCWTENARSTNITVYSPKRAAFRTLVSDPNREQQSFSNMRLEAQVGLTYPGSIAFEAGDHSNIYSGELCLKVNIDSLTGGDATCFRLHDYARMSAMRYNCLVESAVDDHSGRRLWLSPTSYVTGHGRFYRKFGHTAITDVMESGVDYLGRQRTGWYEYDLLHDELPEYPASETREP